MIRPFALVFLLAVLVVPVGVASASSPADAAKANLARARSAVSLLERDWGEAGGWRGINAWQRFVIADGLIDYVQRSSDRTVIPRIEQVVANRTGLDGNDDDLWAVLAETHLFEINRDPALLATARATFDHIVAGYWDGHCGGGLWWDHARTYKNAITNELLILAAADLYRASKVPGYREWAVRGWRWFAASGMIGVEGLVNDGLDSACHNNGQATYSYNQGVILGGLVSLYAITGDRLLLDRAGAIASVATTKLSDAKGILREPATTLNIDGQIFKGIFAFHAGHLVEALPHGAQRGALATFLRSNADALWASSGQGIDALPAHWEGAKDDASANAETAGLDLFVAASR